MIPLRVYLKNFLCHQEQEFRFDGHPVWLLYGDNGVGKSAVFDGIVYALFGEHYRSSAPNGATDLIRQGESSLRVEFDFEYDQRCYRIWRTRTRSGSTKQGVTEVVEGTPIPVRDVNGVRELLAWVTGTLGLRYDSFVSAVLLRQGAAEKLIDAKPDVRREVFRGIIDLEPFLRLHQAVTGARSEVGGVVRSLRAALERMPTTTEDQLAEATRARDDALAAWETAQITEQAARDLLGHARLWEQLDKTWRDLGDQLEAAADRAARATELERAVNRLRELRVVVPALRDVATRRQALVTAEQELNRLTTDRNATTEAHAFAATAAAQERQKAAEHRDRVIDLDRQAATADHRCQYFRDQIQQAESATELHSRLAARRDELLAFEPDLDSAFAQAEIAVAESQAGKDAIPYLEALARDREVYQRAIKDSRAAKETEAEQAAKIERLVCAETEASHLADIAESRQTDAERSVAVAADRLAAATRRRAEFASLAGMPLCPACGQQIGPEHAAREQVNLEQAVSEAEAQTQQCRREHTTATHAATTARTVRERCKAERRAAAAVRDEATRSRHQAEGTAGEAQIRFEAALTDVSEDFHRRVHGIDVDGFPTAADLNGLRWLRAELPGRTQEHHRLVKKRRDRDTCVSELATLEQAVRAVGAPGDVSATRAELSREECTLRGLTAERTRVDQARRDAEGVASVWGIQLTELSGKSTDLSTQVGRAESVLSAERLRLTDALEAVPAPYRGDLSVALNPLAEELEQLEASSVERDCAAMADDRALHADRTRQLDEAQRQLARIPATARHPAAEVLLQVTAAEKALRTADEHRTAAADRLATLLRQQADRGETEQRLATEERNHTLHDRLAGLLGDRGIQLDLIRDAERQIIELANDVLMRVSVGDLRFDPPDPASDRSFDLTVRRAGCPGPIAVANLSGGQRFRVAVSLALAVCRFANGERRPLESVIIDEGFGCLDRDGRMAMIAELRDGQTLSRMFKRVLVVSHQEDFAAAFPVGYRLWSEGGMTKVESFGCRVEQ